MSALTAPVAERIRELHAIGLPLEDIAQQTGRTVRTVNEVVRGRREGRPLTVAEQRAEDERNGWTPLCMDAGEWDLWRSDGAKTWGHMSAAARPCDDCPLGFAADMRAQGRCNGTPGWTAPEEEPATSPAEDMTMTAPEPAPVTLEGLTGMPRALAISEVVAEQGGDRRAAASKLGIRVQDVGMSLARYGLAPAVQPAAPKAPRVPKNAPGAKAAPAAVPAAVDAPVPDPDPEEERLALEAEAIDEPRVGDATRRIDAAVASIEALDVSARPRSWEEMLRLDLQLAYQDARNASLSLSVAADKAPRLRKLARRARELRRDIADALVERL